jgi:TPR repeat protein
MFFLGLFALRAEAGDWFIRWMTAAASAGEPNAQQALGRFLIDQGREQAAYWLARSIYEHADPMSTVVLCWMMWSGPDWFRHEALAENLLVAEANRGNGGAVRQLGCLYARGCGAVRRGKEKASRLLEIAAAEFGDKAAAEDLKDLEAQGDWVDYAVAAAITISVIVSGFFLIKRFRRP